jgi:hypothetical protein
VGGIVGGRYPDSDVAILTNVKLTKEWQNFEIDLKGKDLRHIIGGFGLYLNKAENRGGARRSCGRTLNRGVEVRLGVLDLMNLHGHVAAHFTLMAQQIKEFTLTGEMKLNESFITRLEWRRDWSNQPYFEVGTTPNARNHQTLLTAGVVVVFKPGMFTFGNGGKP